MKKLQVKNSEFYKAIFENSSAAMTVVKTDGTIVVVNDAFCLFTGYSKKELIGSNLTDKMPPKEFERINRYGYSVLEEINNVRNEYKTILYKKNGEERHCLISISFIESNEKSVITFFDYTKSRNDETRLKKREECDHPIVNFANDIVYSVTDKGIITYVSPNWKEKLGYELDEVINHPLRDFIHPDDIGQAREIIIQDFRAGKKVTGIEYRIRTKDGRWRWCSAAASPIVNIDGEFTSLIGISQDITEKRRVEEVFAENTYFFEESQKAANIGSYKADFVRGSWESSEVLDKIFGIDKDYDRSVTPGWTNLIHPDDRKRLVRYLEQEVIPQHKPFDKEYRIIRKSDGETRWVNGLGKIVNDENGKVNSLIGTVQDITERKRTEQIIKEHQTKLELALKIGHLGPWELDVERNLFYFNDTFYALFRTSSEEIGRNTMTPEEYGSRFVHPEDTRIIASEIKKALETKDFGYTRQLEHRIIYADGEEGYIAVLILVVKNEKGKTIKAFGINQDITARKRTEEELRANERKLQELNTTKDKFFSIIAHDLRSPFNSILGFSELLCKKAKENDTHGIEKLARCVYQSSQTAFDLLTNLLDWSRSETGRMEFSPTQIEITELVNETFELLVPVASDKSITLSSNIPSQLFVFADKSMLSTVLRNLVANAIKFSFPNSVVTISAEKNINEIVVKITDQGIGIPTSQFAKLFKVDESYITLGTNNEKGTGLGLILCKEFIEKHGGKIGVQSQYKKGSEFYFTLPRKKYIAQKK